MHPVQLAGRVMRSGGLLLFLAACAGDQEPTAPSMPAAPSQFEGPSFRLKIDVATGDIRVEPPPVASGASLSLIGSEAIALHASACTWTSVPKNNRLKRCTFTLAIENKLRETDLVTPTDFPTPPAGTAGLLVFPFTAAAQGVPGTGATPSPDWDNAPANFFNDFATCPTSTTSDCYRWELFASPLAARATSAARQVGFDVDKAAQSVSVGIAVAANLRDRPLVEFRIGSGGDECGIAVRVDGEPVGVIVNPAILHLAVGARQLNGGLRVSRTFCTFGLPPLVLNNLFVDARLEMEQEGSDFGRPFDALGSVLAEHVQYGASLDNGDFDAQPLQPAVTVLSSTPEVGVRSVDVTRWVMDDIANLREQSQFRLRFASEAPAGDGGETSYTGWTNGGRPTLVVHYREK